MEFQNLPARPAHAAERCLFMSREHRKGHEAAWLTCPASVHSHQANHWQVSFLLLHRRGCYIYRLAFKTSLLLRLYHCWLQRLTVPVVPALQQLPVTFLQLEHRRLLDNLMSTTNEVKCRHFSMPLHL